MPPLAFTNSWPVIAPWGVIVTTTEPSDCGLPISIFILDEMLSFRSVVDELQLGRLFRSESATERLAVVGGTAFGRGD